MSVLLSSRLLLAVNNAICLLRFTGKDDGSLDQRCAERSPPAQGCPGDGEESLSVGKVGPTRPVAIRRSGRFRADNCGQAVPTEVAEIARELDLTRARVNPVVTYVGNTNIML